jgi:hypothetical protein
MDIEHSFRLSWFCGHESHEQDGERLRAQRRSVRRSCHGLRAFRLPDPHGPAERRPLPPAMQRMHHASAGTCANSTRILKHFPAKSGSPWKMRHYKNERAIRFVSKRKAPSLKHFPEKWTPVFRRKCDQLKKLERVSDST